MKRVLIAAAVVVAILIGLFLWKGGHHALVLANVLDEWMDADSADQTLTLSIDSTTGKINQETIQFSLAADSFWTEYADARVFGLTTEGITAYLCERNLYLDTGKAYALPELPELERSIKRLSQGLILYVRVTKTGDTYHISMKTEELELSAAVTVDHTVRAVSVQATLADDTIIDATLTSKESLPHPIPQSVADAMVLARMERPMSLTEPLEILIPAMEKLQPLSGDLKLGVSCGILELTETVQLTVQGNNAALTRKGKALDLELPTNLSPVALAALLLRDGEFTRTDDGSLFTVNLPSETATDLLEALVPQAADLGITLGDCVFSIFITGDRLTSVSLAAEGSVPFLFTTIPVDFTAELTVT